MSTRCTIKLIVIPIALIGFMAIGWYFGSKQGYKEGASDEADNFQVMLDANVYWAHRESLRSLSGDKKLAIEFHRKAIIDYHQRVAASDSKSDIRADVRLNYIMPVDAEYSELMELADKLRK